MMRVFADQIIIIAWVCIQIIRNDQLPMSPDPEILKSLVSTQMPFGKYKGTLLCDLPDYYLEWFSRKGFPPGKLGMQLSTVFEIKQNGLHEILHKLKRMR
jgi:uncharacterized protein (DUF3820 family)